MDHMHISGIEPSSPTRHLIDILFSWYMKCYIQTQLAVS